MHQILLLGAGKIGRMIARFLVTTGDYAITIADVDETSLRRISNDLEVETLLIDATDSQQLKTALQSKQSVVSALSFRFNPQIAQAALETGVNYFDLTEDVETTKAVRRIAAAARPGQIFMPQCGLAPGFISIVAHDVACSFEQVDRIHMRVGALPQFPTGQLKYNLTWSTDGLINEYCNPCEAIQDGKVREVLPLEGYEHFSLDGIRYEAFNTSGGLGTLCETWTGRIREMNYKTVRYLGHCELMQVLVNELRLREDQETLKRILENAVPITFQDVVVTFVTAAGIKQGELVQVSDARKIYASSIDDTPWSAIQITTAAGICTVIDLHASGQLPSQGFVRQEEVKLDVFLNNRFGRYYRSQVSTRFSQGSRDDLSGDDHVPT